MDETVYKMGLARPGMDERLGSGLAIIGVILAVLIALVGVLQLPGSVSGSDGVATGATLVVTAGVAVIVILLGRFGSSKETTMYW